MLKYLFNSKAKIIEQMQEKQPLPLGVQEFEEWSDRIISGALLTATKETQKFALADMILHLGATEDHKEDAYFIKTLRKTAVNQVASFMRDKIRTEAKARMDAEEKAKAAQKAQLEAALETDYVPPQVGELAEHEENQHPAEAAHDVLEKQTV